MRVRERTIEVPGHVNVSGLGLGLRGVVVAAVIECCCFLVHIIVGPPEPWLPLVLCNCRHF